MTAKNERIWFAQMLRGVAILMVLISHYGYGFWLNNDIAAALAKTQTVDVDLSMAPVQFGLWLSHLHVDFGALGVAIFFLISGFVIPMSIENSGIGQFLVRRFFRIYPPYAIGLLMTLLAIYIYTASTGAPFPYTTRDYLANASLLRDWFWIPSIDNVNWTLEMELKFYVICGLLTAVSSLQKPKTILVTAAAMCIFTLAMTPSLPYLLENQFSLYVVVYVISLASSYLTTMLIGIGFYNLYRSHWSLRTFLVVTGLLVVIYGLDIALGPFPANALFLYPNYTYALIIFAGCFYYRDRIPYSRVLNFFAEISYPLYILHAIIGYILLTVFYTLYPNPYVAVGATLLIVVFLSYLHHIWIEVPSNRLGKSLARSLRTRSQPAVADLKSS